MLTQNDLITVDGIPAHPLIVHAVVVLLPLAAVGGLVIALRASWRRRFGMVVLALAVLSVAAVPLATRTGNQLKTAMDLPDNQLIERHADLGDELLPFALAFGIAVLFLVIAGRLADRERAATTAPSTDTGGTDDAGNTDDTVADRPVGAVSNLWRRLAIVAAALVAFTGVASTVQVLRIGHSGSSAVWEGVGGSP